MDRTESETAGSPGRGQESGRRSRPANSIVTAIRRGMDRSLSLILVAAAANMIYLLTGHTYDLQVGPLHLAAHELAKPLHLVCGLFVTCALFRRPGIHESSRTPQPETPAFWETMAQLVGCATIVIALAYVSVDINPLHDEWNYRGRSAGIQTLPDFVRLFTDAQFSTWYRPLGFASLWLDYRIFRDNFWGYHVQNIALHMLNAVLAGALAGKLGAAKASARWIGILFAAAAVTFEPVMWPSARFDLLAVTFTCIGLISAREFLAGESRRWLWSSLACYLLAVLSKESGYAFPFLAAVIAAGMGPVWRTERRRTVALAAGVLLMTAALVVIRLAVLNGIGGYQPEDNVASVHLSFGSGTAMVLLTRVLTTPLLGVNLSYPAPAVVLIAIGAFVVLLAVGAMLGAATTPRQRLMALCAVLAAVPVAALVSWIPASMQHARYLYMPALFVVLFTGMALSNARRSGALLALFAALNLGCGIYNMWIYKTMYCRVDQLAAQIARDYGAVSGEKEIRILGMPPEPDGVFFLRLELLYRIQERARGVSVRTLTAEENGRDNVSCGGQLCYTWQTTQRTLSRSQEN